MNKLVKNLINLFFVLVILVCSVVPSFAAGSLNIDGTKGINKGDKVTYTLMLGDCSELIEAMQMCVFYDADYLEIDDTSVIFPNVAGMVSNAGKDGVIYFNFTNVSNPCDFTETKELMVVDFTAKKSGKTSITYFVTEMYGSKAFVADDDGNLQPYLKSYTFTYKLAVNDEQKVESGTPIVTTDDEYKNTFQGEFINYVDGKGEKNADTSNQEHVAETGVTTQATTNAQATVVTTQSAEGSSSTVNYTTVGLVILGIIILCAVVILIVLKNVFAKKNQQED